MRRLKAASAGLLCVFALTPTVSRAESSIFVQLGNAPTQEEASVRFSALREQFPVQLNPLPARLREVTSLDGDQTSWRIHAGPLPSRDKAYRLCSDLVAKNQECFVVETAVAEETAPVIAQAIPLPARVAKKPEREEEKSEPIHMAEPVALPEEPVSAPMAQSTEDGGDEYAKHVNFNTRSAIAGGSAESPSQAQEIASADEDDGFSIWPWNWFRDDEKAPRETSVAAGAAPSPAPEKSDEPASPATSMAAAEPALPSAPMVPARGSSALPWLDEQPGFTPEGKVEVAEAIPVSPAAPAPSVTVTRQGKTPLSASRNSALWLQVGPFEGDRAAFDFWQQLRRNVNEVSGMRARLARPFADRTGSRMFLRIGPVAGRAELTELCQSVRTQASSLQCAPVSQMTSVNTATPPVTPRDYNARRASATLSRSGSGSGARQTGARADTGGGTWIQLGSFSNAGAARAQFKQLQAAQPTLLKYAEPVITQPARSSAPVFRLRLGPYKDSGRANTLCNQLAQTGVSCLVLTD